MIAFQNRLDEVHDAGATVVGISADSPFSLDAFAEEYGIEFTLVSDMGRDAIETYDLAIDAPGLGLHGAANRAVFVVDDERTVTYAWVADDPTNEPPYDEILAVV